MPPTRMQKNLVRFLITLGACGAVLYPVMVWYAGTQLPLSFLSLFPVFGIVAFTVMWLHIVGGACKTSLERYIDFESFVHNTSFVVLTCIILHPLLLLVGLGIHHLEDVFSYGSAHYVWYAVIGWFFLISYDINKIFRERDFFPRHQQKVLIMSTIGFFFIFFHSLGLGHDLQGGPLRALWIFYGITAALAALYLYVFKR